MAGSPLGAGILGVRGPVFCFPIVAAPSTAFSSIYRPRVWRRALMPTPVGRLPGPYRALRIGKIAERSPGAPRSVTEL